MPDTPSQQSTPRGTPGQSTPRAAAERVQRALSGFSVPDDISDAVGEVEARAATAVQAGVEAAGDVREIAQASYHDDLEDPTFALVADKENIYDFLMFISPTDGAHSNGKLTIDITVGYLLVLLTLLIQGLLLTAVYNRVVVGAVEWKNGIFQSEGNKAWSLLAQEDFSQCNMGDSLCTMKDHTFECAPPSVRLSGKWNELDLNHDNVWTREEAISAKDELKCKYVVDPVELFDVFINFVKKRDNIIWVHPDILQGRAISKPYFDYAMGDIIMCGYRNEAMCRNVLQRGFFDAPLTHNTVPRVGNTSTSAINYCVDLLRTGGVCDRVLPSTYSVWKIQSDEECKGKWYTKFVYKHPVTGVEKSFLSVDYEARQEAERVQTVKFKIFKTIIVMVWVMSMVYELKRLFEIYTWIFSMPGEQFCRDQNLPLCEDRVNRPRTMLDDEGKPQRFELSDNDKPQRFKINGISPLHRICVVIVTTLRLIMLSVLTIVGLSLLLHSPEYMTLLFDAISLVFILDLASIIAKYVLRQSVREQCAEEVEPIEVTLFGPTAVTRRQSIMDMAWFAVIALAAICIVWYFYADSVIPLDEALQCTCLGVGESCVEAQKFNYDFWYTYWKDVTPQIFKDVDALRRRTEGLLFQVEASSSSSGFANRTATAMRASGRRKTTGVLLGHVAM
jgi:hypothetical protein